MRSGRVVAVILCAASVTACTRTDRVAALRHAPEASLRYPGSTVVDRWETKPGRNAVDGRSHGASLGVKAETAASPDDIMRFFADALTRRGWRHNDDSLGPAIGYFRDDSWLKGGRVFGVMLAHGSKGHTVVETSLAERD